MSEHDLDMAPEVPRTYHQLGILVLDGSGSMKEITADRIRKAEAVHGVVRDLFGLFKTSRAKKNFSMAVVTFDTAARIHTPATPVEHEQINVHGDFNPLNGHGGGTDIGAGLRCAQGIAQSFLSETNGESVPRSVVVILMSDGQARDGDGLSVADEIKQIPNVTLCTTLFSAVGENVAADMDLLRKIATSPSHYETTDRADKLREFFFESLTASKNVKIA